MIFCDVAVKPYTYLVSSEIKTNSNSDGFSDDSTSNLKGAIIVKISPGCLLLD